MRWTSSIKIDNFGEVINSIKSLNEVWYLSKKAFFLKESGYNPKLNKIVVFPNKRSEVYTDDDTGEEFPNVFTFDGVPEYYTLLNYCWSSKFEGCLAYNNVELVANDPFEIHALPIDSKTLCDSIINYYEVFFKGVSDTNFIAQEIIANLKAIEVAFAIKNDSSEFENTKKDIFLTIERKILDVYGSHVTLFKSHSSNSIERTLTIDICNQIAEFKLGNKKLITSIEGDVTSGVALYHLFSYATPPNRNIKIYIDEWQKKDVYYLLIRLSMLVSETFNIAEIERKQMLFLKVNQSFKSSSYDTFKSNKYKNEYPSDPHKPLIDTQLTALFS